MCDYFHRKMNIHDEICLVMIARPLTAHAHWTCGADCPYIGLSATNISGQLVIMAGKCLSPWLLLQVSVQFVLIVNPSRSSPEDKIIRIGDLLQRLTRAGAINVAIEQVENDGLLRDYNFRYRILSVILQCSRTSHGQLFRIMLFGKILLMEITLYL